MLWLVVTAGVLAVGAKEVKTLTSKEVLDDKEVAETPVKDPWSPIIGDTEGTRPITPRVRSWTGTSPSERSNAPVAAAGRRANDLVENLRRQLMRDNYDYIGTDSAEHSSPTSARTSSTTRSPVTSTTASTTTSTTTASTPHELEVADAMQPKFVKSPYYQALQSSLLPKQYPVVRAQQRVSRMQMASVNLPVFPMTRVTTTGPTPSKTRQSPAAVRPYIAVLPRAAVHPNIPAQPPATLTADDPSVADNPSVPENPQSSVQPSARPVVPGRAPAAAPPSISFHPVGGAAPVQQFRSFDEAYNTPSPLLEHGTEPKREVFKKDLLYYVDDDRLNTGGLHLRRNNYLSSEGHHAHEHYGDSASALSAQSGQDLTTQADTSQQEHHGRRGHHRGAGRDAMYGRLRESARHTHRKTKRRYKRKHRPVDGIKRRARLYGLRPKDYGYSKHYAPRELNRQQMNNHNSEYEPEDDIKRKDPYDAPINGQRNQDNFNFRRNNQAESKQGLKPKNVIDSQNNSTSDKKDDEHSSSQESGGSTEDQETNTEINENNDKKHIVNTTHDHNKHKEIKQEPIKEEDANNDHKTEVNEDNIDNTQKIDEEHHVSEEEEEEDGQRNTGQKYSQYLEETTSNVKYKLLKVRSLGGSRRSGSGGTHHILQERGSQGVALISMDQAPFPQFQLPRARRQYMQESGRARHPLREQLPKPTSVARRKYKGHQRSSH